MRRHICLVFPIVLVILVLLNSNDVLVESRALRSEAKSKSTNHDATERVTIIGKVSFSSSAKKKRDKVLARYQISTMASGPSRKGSGH